MTLGANALTVSQSTDTTFSGTIGGTGSLTKAGTGVLTLSGTGNSATAWSTTISGGTLVVDSCRPISAPARSRWRAVR